MIRNKLAQSRATMATAARLRDDRAATDKLNTQLEALKDTAGKLATLLTILDAVQKANVSSRPLSEEQCSSLKGCIENCGRKAQNFSLTEADVSSLQVAMTSCRSAAESQWKSDASTLANGIYNSLNTLSNLLPNRDAANKLLRDLAAGKSTLPSSPKDVTAFIANVRSAQTMVNSLQLDPEVEEFITKVRQGKATLTDLSEHTLQWVRDNHLTGKLKIQF